MTETRVCVFCGERKPLDQYVKRGAVGYERICRADREVASREDWAEARRQTHKAYTVAHSK